MELQFLFLAILFIIVYLFSITQFILCMSTVIIGYSDRPIHVSGVLVPDVLVPAVLVPDVLVPDVTVPGGTFPGVLVPGVVFPDVVVLGSEGGTEAGQFRVDVTGHQKWFNEVALHKYTFHLCFTHIHILNMPCLST